MTYLPIPVREALKSGIEDFINGNFQSEFVVSQIDKLIFGEILSDDSHEFWRVDTFASLVNYEGCKTHSLEPGLVANEVSLKTLAIAECLDRHLSPLPKPWLPVAQTAE